MKTNLLFFILLLTALSCRQQSATLTDAQKSQIEKAVHELWETKFEVLNTMDLEGLNRTNSQDEFLGYAVGGHFTIKSRQAYMDSCKAWWNSRVEQKGKLLQVDIHALSDDLALVDYTSTWQGIQKDGQTSHFNVSNTLLCRNEETGWKIIYEHESWADIE